MAKMLRSVGASTMVGTYNAGAFVTDTDAEACELARERYANSELGRAMKDAYAFTYYVTDRMPVDGGDS